MKNTCAIKSLRVRLTALCLVLVSVSISGCAAASDLSFSQFTKAEDSFNFPKTEWGMTVDEAEKALGYKLGLEPAVIESEPADYSGDAAYTGTLYKEETYSLSGVKGTSYFQFMNGRLWAAGTTWQVEKDGDKMFDNAVREAVKEFGGETESVKDKAFNNPLQEDGPELTNTSYVWERKDSDGGATKCMLAALKQDGVITSVDFGAAEFPIQY